MANQTTSSNQFEFLFEEDHYTGLKDYLYSYVLRKIAVNRMLRPKNMGMALELGSGLSPVTKPMTRLVYSDLSFLALKHLKKKMKKGMYVVADGMNLPFREGAFSHVVCSEVLEHIPDDERVMREMARVMRPSGQLILTFPHRSAYYTFDDRFVSHLRRYEIGRIRRRLQQYGFQFACVRKVLGPMDKATICLLIFLFLAFQKSSSKTLTPRETFPSASWVVVLFKVINYAYASLAWLDARLTPMSMSPVLLVSAILRKNVHPNAE